MGIYIDQMFNEVAARTTETQMLAGTGTTAGLYSPQFNGKLIKIDIYCTPQAVTSLCESGHVRLNSTLWKPNSIIFPFNGWALQTAPAAIGSKDKVTSYVVDLEVATDKPIDSLMIEFDSPVTPRIRVVGTFTN